jgi:flagellin-like hook-associated protein FlgL
MSGIALSRGIRDNLFSLQQSSDGIAVAQNRLATGKKVNSAIDNPTNFFTSAALNSRANDLNGLLDGISNALKTVEAADNGIKSITRLVENAQAAARSALQSTSSNVSTTGTVTGLNASTVLGTAGSIAFKLGGGTTQTVSVTATDTVKQVLDKVNAVDGARAELTSAGELKLTALNGESLEITAANAQVGFAVAAAQTQTAGNQSTARQNLAKQFNDLRTQITQLSKDAGYNGVNLLSGGALKVLFNEKTEVADQSTLSIKGVNFDATGIGIDAIDTAGAKGFQSDSEINKALKGLEGALSSLRGQSATFGSNLAIIQTRNDFTKLTVNTLKSGADGLVLADQNEEAANLLTLQTRQQLSQQALALASQQQQGVLRLLG